MPEFTPQVLPTDRHNGENMDLDMGASDDYVEIEDIDHGESSWGTDVNEGLLIDHNLVEIPTQCSRPNTGKSTYVNPLGYVSNEDEEYEEDGEEDEEEEVVAGDMNLAETSQGCFPLGMTFPDVQEARAVIHEYAVKFGYRLKFEKNEKTRLRVSCLNANDCPFKLYVSTDGDKGGMIVKTAYTDHKCFRQVDIPSASSSYVARHFKDTIYNNVKFRAKDMKHEFEKNVKIKISKYKCKRAKRKLLHDLEGSYKQEFAILEAYAEKLKECNPGTKCEIELSKEGSENGKRIFRRCFVMLEACKRNWLAGCRPLICLDGCFLKGVCQGVLLTAVGVDGDDQVVPIAWAVATKENKVNWRWFMCWLRQELQLEDGEQLTIMSDMQKGLIDAVQNTLPKAEHRWCVRHIHANWSKKWPGNELRKRLWICAWSTFEEDFKSNLAKMGEVHKKATEDLLKYPVQTWCRAYQSDRCKCYIVDNNLSESFNSSILEARHKPIKSMLEDIRIYTMGKIRDKKRMCDSWICEWSPAAMEIYEVNKAAAIGCRVVWNGDTGYEIGDGEDRHTVILDKHICTCRRWQLTGIPCMHAISAMFYSKIDPLGLISKWYHKSTYKKAYQFTISPVPGGKFFNKEKHLPIEPPPVQKMPGRPKKKGTSHK